MKMFKVLTVVGILSLVSVMSYGLSHLSKHSKFHSLVNDAIHALQEVAPMVEKKNNILSRAKYTKEGYDQMVAQVNQDVMDRLQKAQELINSAMAEVSMQ
jgi:hypothetical protein